MRNLMFRCGAIWMGSAAFCLTISACGMPQSKTPSVVIVLIDQLRKDSSDQHLTNVNELARGGIVFEDMRSAAPWTYPSVISLMSGLYPQQHGASLHPERASFSRFDPELPLLQTRLRSAGYATAAFVTNPYLMKWNAFHRGFDLFDDHFVSSTARSAGGIRSIWKPETMFANSVNAAIRKHFDGRRALAPEFTYIHYIDAHGPWEGAPFEGDYEHAIAYLDEKVVELYEYFLERYTGNLLFIVTADHGREMGDDREVGSGSNWRFDKHSVHDFNLRIPFMILPSEALPARRRIEGACSHVDLVPTLLEWLDLESPIPLPGVSLLSAITGQGAVPENRSVYAADWGGGGIFTDAVIVQNWKYMRFLSRPNGKELARRAFDLALDPRETSSVSERFEVARDVLDDAAGTQGVLYPAKFVELSEAVKDQLRALGYLQESE